MLMEDNHDDEIQVSNFNELPDEATEEIEETVTNSTQDADWSVDLEISNNRDICF